MWSEILELENHQGRIDTRRCIEKILNVSSFFIVPTDIVKIHSLKINYHSFFIK